jgi:hypothetical protein
MSKGALRLAYIGAVVLIAAYAWFATGVKPFHVLAYVVVGIPIFVVVGLYAVEGTFAEGPASASRYYRERAASVLLSRSTPWLVVLLGAVVLEAVGLLLGGRSSRVPTLSTMVDHLLRTHGLRCALYLLWLAVGLAPLRRLHQRRGGAATP